MKIPFFSWFKKNKKSQVRHYKEVESCLDTIIDLLLDIKIELKRLNKNGKS